MTLKYMEHYTPLVMSVRNGVLAGHTKIWKDAIFIYLGFDFITLDGDKIEGKGVMTGGYLNKNNLLNRFLNFRY